MRWRPWEVRAIPTLLILFAFNSGARGSDQREIRGRVVDEACKPVAGVAVDCFWRANGSGRDRDGRPLDLAKKENVTLFWSNLGEMAPTQSPGVTTGADGRFTLKVSEIYFAVMAIDSSRRLGGIAVPPKGRETEPLEIKLAPLVRVRGSFEGPGPKQQPHWTHVYVNLPEDPARPLHSTRLVGCGSFEARFEVWLPPGRYFLHAYSQFSENDLFEGELIPDREMMLSRDKPEVDLGKLTFSPHRIQNQARKAKAEASGTWSDYTRHYGERPPRWHITDARGVRKDVQLADFKGKWVLVEFWGFGCRPCLWTSLPKLMTFYEQHAAKRDRFEILAVCLDPDGELKSMADVDRKLEPIVKHVWGGKNLPFPVLLDSTFQTWERFGLPGMGTVILIDPNGKLVEGDETVLAEKLK